MWRDEPVLQPHGLADLVRAALVRALGETSDPVLALFTATREVRQAVPDLGFCDAYLLVDRLWVR